MLISLRQDRRSMLSMWTPSVKMHVPGAVQIYCAQKQANECKPNAETSFEAQSLTFYRQKAIDSGRREVTTLTKSLPATFGSSPLFTQNGELAAASSPRTSVMGAASYTEAVRAGWVPPPPGWWEILLLNQDGRHPVQSNKSHNQTKCKFFISKNKLASNFKT